MGCSHIQRLAEYVAAEYGLPRVDRALVRRMYAQATPIPISLENENGQLWVDKYYLAYRLPDGVTHYVYLSRTHIREEYRSYQAAAASREQRFAMPVEYQRIFHKVGFSMFLAGHQIWIEKKFLEKISEKQAS